jgi:tetratricopeptide (TPR) repeat protein
VVPLAPEELRRRQFAALTSWTFASAKVQPVALAFEDLHWAAPRSAMPRSTSSVVGSLAPLFIVATSRPEFRPPWDMRSHHATIALAPLDRTQVPDMIVELSARHALPREVADNVAARTGGVPLFVEEVTRLLLERGEKGGIHEIPPSLRQSLMARLDRLGPAREVAQVGSVIGHGFSYGLLRALARMEDAELQATLERLTDADILLVQGLPPDSDYRFKHALIQDAAYENLLKSRRQVLHRRVAEILRERFPDTAAAEPEVLAHHFTQVGLTDAAIEWWGKASDQALRRFAFQFQEAISHLGKAIEMADKTGGGASAAAATSASANRRPKLQTDLGKALMYSRGYGAHESRAAFIRARELAAATEDATERFTIYYGLWIGNTMRGELGFAREIAETFLREAERGGLTTECGFAHRLLGHTRLRQGDFIEAQANLVRALSIYDPERDRETRFRFGLDTGAIAKALLAITKWQLGEVGPARALIEEAVAHAMETGHVPTLVHLCKLVDIGAQPPFLLGTEDVEVAVELLDVGIRRCGLADAAGLNHHEEVGLASIRIISRAPSGRRSTDRHSRSFKLSSQRRNNVQRMCLQACTCRTCRPGTIFLLAGDQCFPGRVRWMPSLIRRTGSFWTRLSPGSVLRQRACLETTAPGWPPVSMSGDPATVTSPTGWRKNRRRAMAF